MKRNNDRSGDDVVRLLAAGASALASAHAAAAEGDGAHASYRITRYEEDSVDARDVSLGSTERYGISTQQLNVFVPLEGRWAIEVDALHETMSGASPYYNVLGPDGVRVVMTGASIRDERSDVNVTGQYDGDNADVAVSAGRSVEDDYDANYASLGVDYGFNLDNTVLSLSFGTTSDDLSPTDAEIHDRVREAHKSGRSLFMAVSQVLAPDWIVQGGIGFNRLEGYLTDPYKAGDVDAPLENRPDSRNERTLSLRSRYFIDAWKSSLRTDYRYYTDDWGIDSHTLTLGLEKETSATLTLTTDLRWYSQREADFYVPHILAAPPRYYATDYRLSAFGALSVDVGARWQVSKDWRIVGVVERYVADDAYALDDAALENPAWTKYWRLSIGVDASF